MFEIFRYIDKFFTSLTNYVTYNDIFIIFVGLFLVTLISVVVSTSHAYEAKLIKAIDKFNTYFIDNPQINEDNLVAFNAKMKAKFVPKQLRKCWQQFVLYREAKASSYMSFENCVSNPIKNSSFTRDTKLMNILAYVFSFCALILNCYYCYETADLASVVRTVTLTPILILLINYIAQIFFKVKHSAIVSDLFQNYQYFEVNIDKATTTLPEYVDYEVLFDRNEIKKGIPILYAYLQKRAEEEQRELERARLKNVEHEKFNFDDAGVEASLVLERAMQEAENYIAERKKYNQDTEQINNDITQEDLNYREITKEYNRQMQVSRETFANFKAQLEEVSSSIEANYLKKQQQQELDRQRNLERDYDTATERHKKIIENYQSELDTVDKFIADSRKSLESAMKSEFSTYSSKVYDAAKKAVDEREKEKYQQLRKQMNELEEMLAVKEKELEDAYNQNQVISERLSNYEEVGPIVRQNKEEDEDAGFNKNKDVYNEEMLTPNANDVFEEAVNQEEVTDEANFDNVNYDNNESLEQFDEQNYQEYPDNTEAEYQEYDENLDQNYQSYEDQNNLDYNANYQENDQNYQEFDQNYQPEDQNYSDYAEDDQQNYQAYDNQNYGEFNEFDDQNYQEYDESDFDQMEDGDYNYEDEFDDYQEDEQLFDVEVQPSQKIEDLINEEYIERVEDKSNKKVQENEPISTATIDDSIKKEQVVTSKGEESQQAQGEKKSRGRPRKVQEEKPETEKRKPGRPRKQVDEAASNKPKRGRGRPKKVQEKEEVSTPKRGRGRPKKSQETKPQTVKKGPGRPKKTQEKSEVVTEQKRGRGRPKKQTNSTKQTQNKEVKKVENNSDALPENIDDIDMYIKQIDAAIAEENAKLEETKKELDKNSKLRKKK